MSDCVKASAEIRLRIGEKTKDAAEMTRTQRRKRGRGRKK